MPDGAPPPRMVGALYNYALAANGLFIRAQREGLEACVPVSEGFEVRGLGELEPFAKLSHPRVSPGFVKLILDLSRSACVTKKTPTEALFHLWWLEGEKRWRLDRPKQEATATSVRPLEDGEGSSYQIALIEVHSHHEMDPTFSEVDDADEQGFRIYGVIGNIFDRPKLRVRVGCYGHFLELPAEEIFYMPEEVEDATRIDAEA